MDATGFLDVRQFTISQLLEFLSEEAPISLEFSERAERLISIFGDGSKVSRTGELKADVVIELGKRLVGWEGLLPFGLDSKEDFLRFQNLDIRERIDVLRLIERSITNRESGVASVGIPTIRRLLVLMGLEIVMPDRTLIRWVQNALGGMVGAPSPYRAAELVERAARELQHSMRAPSIRQIDQIIRQAQAGRSVSLGAEIGALGPTAWSGSPSQTEFAIGDEVDWNPPGRAQASEEKWHGTIIDFPRPLFALVEWTKTDRYGDFRRGTRRPLRLPFKELVRRRDLIPCLRDQLGDRHPGDLGPDDWKVGEVVFWGLDQVNDPIWRGKIVNRVNGSHDRFIVRWDEVISVGINSNVTEQELNAACPIFRVEIAKNLERNPWDEVLS
jgi:hypothetical protein